MFYRDVCSIVMYALHIMHGLNMKHFLYCTVLYTINAVNITISCESDDD